MPRELPKSYDPKDVEDKWRAFWEENQVFTPDPDGPGKPYSIVIPPPNVTGALHIGHALNLSLIDTLCRHARQLGCNVLWIPGTDHAGISTQNVVERTLAKEGHTREELGREEFVRRIWSWRDEYGHRILNQIRSLGCSVDWTRLRFTMDEGLSRAVRKVFVQLYNEGLIYRGDYIVNWCSRCSTALADDEVEHENEPGKLWKVKYRVADSDEFVTVATTRPETIPGDTAVCVNPADKRYTHLIGMKAYVPVVNREVPIIADSYVDMEYGTGCLKVTPAHDMNDWQLGQKHNLEAIQVIDGNGVMTEAAGPYVGKTISECRKAILEDLAGLSALAGEEAVQHAVGRCYRCHTVIEPHVSRQWFVAATKLAPAARAAVPAETSLYPESWLKTYYHWLDNIRDWCISRQIWWGHRIPAWTCQKCGKLIVSETDPASCPDCGCVEMVQEEDVLDTWFSSSLWPFSILGWPEDTPELRRWYPTTVLVTAFDILFFWVARMMMMGIHFLGKPPFDAIYLHALVRDAQGQKMSKSKGNGIDPLEMIDKFGCDATRFTLISMAAMGRDIRISEDKIENSRHFINKLWNAARFALLNLPDDVKPVGKIDRLYQIWLLDRLENTRKEVQEALAEYRFNDAAMGVYRFMWNEFCDWFVELSKPDLQSEDPAAKAAAQYVLWLGLRRLLLFLYPMTPFVTAAIWASLPGSEADPDIARVPWPAPAPEFLHPDEAAQMEFIKSVIVAIRTIKAELGIPPSRKVAVVIHPATVEQQRLLEENAGHLASLARLESWVIDSSAATPRASATQVVEGCQISVPLAGNINLTDELARLDKEIGRLDQELVGVQKKLHNESFNSRAPAEVVARERAREESLLDARKKLAARRELFVLAGQE